MAEFLLLQYRMGRISQEEYVFLMAQLEKEKI